MKRMVLPIVVCAVLVAGLMGGCSRVDEGDTGEPVPQVRGEKVRLTLFTWTARDEEEANLELIRKFEEYNPGIEVRLQNETAGSQQAMQKLQTMLAAKQGPDVISIHRAFFIPLASKGALMDIERLAHADMGFSLDDFSKEILDICRYEGTIYSLPRYTSVYTLFYNKTLFDEARLPYPGQGDEWTWDEYLKTARALTKDTSGDGSIDQWGTIIDFWGARIYPWLWQNNASLMNEDLSRCVLDSPEAIEALEFVNDLRSRHKVAAESDNAEHNSALNGFLQGNIGMYMTGPWDIQLLRNAPGLQWDVAPLPKGKSQATMLGTENYGIWQGTKHPEESWKLFTFLLSSETQQYMAEKLEKMPSRVSVLQGPYMQAETDHNRQVFVESLRYARQPENVPEWSQIKDLIQDQLDLIWVGRKSVAEGLRDAANNVNKTLAELRGS